MKKRISLLLSVIMLIVCCVPATVSAATLEREMIFEYGGTRATLTTDAKLKSVGLTVEGSGLAVLDGVRNFKSGKLTVVHKSASAKYNCTRKGAGKIAATTTSSSAAVIAAGLFDKLMIENAEAEDVYVAKGVKITKNSSTQGTLFVPAGTKAIYNGKVLRMNNWYDMTIKMEGITASKLKTGSLDNRSTKEIALAIDSLFAAISGKSSAKATISFKYSDNYDAYVAKRDAQLKDMSIVNLKLTSSSSTHKVYGTWDKSKDLPLTGYQVYRKKSTNKTYGKVATTTKNSYTSAKLKKGTKYSYKVRGYWKDGRGNIHYTKWSTVKTITVK